MKFKRFIMRFLVVITTIILPVVFAANTDLDEFFIVSNNDNLENPNYVTIDTSEVYQGPINEPLDMQMEKKNDIKKIIIYILTSIAISGGSYLIVCGTLLSFFPPDYVYSYEEPFDPVEVFMINVFFVGGPVLIGGLGLCMVLYYLFYEGDFYIKMIFIFLLISSIVYTILYPFIRNLDP